MHGYSLIDPDGTERVVEYLADDVNGFNAVVKRYGHARHPLIYGKPYPYPGVGLPIPEGVPIVVPYKRYYGPGPYTGAYSYQNIEQYH